MYKNKELIIRNIIAMVSSQFNTNVSLCYESYTFINGVYHINIGMDIDGHIELEIIDMNEFSLDSLYKKLMNDVKDKILESYEVN